MSICPECENPLELDPDALEAGDTFECDECGMDLEVVSVEPLELTVLGRAGYYEEDEPSYSAGE